jgi:gamma-glutamylcyclotransferase (GGCT)/AIG2-like uncharacterized protein YtfP
MNLPIKIFFRRRPHWCIPAAFQILSVGFSLANTLSIDSNSIAENLPVGSIVGKVDTGNTPVVVDGSLWVSGENGQGQLGDGTLTTKYGFRQIVDSGVVAIFAGSYGTSAFLKEGGAFWVMGSNLTGELGLGHPETSGIKYANSPVELVGSGVVDVALGKQHTLFLKQDGSLWGMGADGFGQIANNLENSYTPKEIVPSDVIDVAAGARHTVFVKSDGTVWGMGTNYGGELGNGIRGEGTRDSFDEGMDSKEPLLTFDKNIAEVFSYKWSNYDYNWGSFMLGKQGELYSSILDYPVFSHGVSKVSGNYATMADGSVWLLQTAMGNSLKLKTSNVTAFSAHREEYITVKQDNSVWVYGIQRSAFGSGHLFEFKNDADEWLVEDFYNPQLQLVSGEGDTDNSKFAIEGNQLIALESFNYEQQNSYSIRLGMVTPEGSRVEASIKVDIIDAYEGTGKAFKSAGVKQGNGWQQIDWFGMFYPYEDGNWNYHMDLAWVYVPLSQGGDTIWMWHPGQGWIWTGKDTFPWLFSNRLQTWLYFDPTQPERRLFQSNANQWIYER